jgi:dTDP-4-amino-4,6-dideoxygalactose transaminase
LEVNYDRPLPEENELSKFPNAVWAAHNLVLLPLYARLSPGDAKRIAQEITRI